MNDLALFFFTVLAASIVALIVLEFTLRAPPTPAPLRPVRPIRPILPLYSAIARPRKSRNPPPLSRCLPVA